MGSLDETDLIYVNTRFAGSRLRPRSSRRRVLAAAAWQTVNRTPPNGADVRPLFDRERMPAPVRRRLRNVRMFGANIPSLGDLIWSIPDEFS
jgi:hypothetical protein